MTILSIIILNYNTKELLHSCIESMLKVYKKEVENGTFEIIVVDNASTDGSLESIENARIKKISNRENYGFSKGNNIGAKQAEGKYILFLNSDTLVLDKGFLDVVAFLENNATAGIVGGKLINVNGSAQPSTGKFYSLSYVFLNLFGLERLGMVRISPSKTVPVNWVSGASLLIRKSLFKRLGGFDEQFFMYMEDMELCFRAKKLGFKTYFFPNVSIVHKGLGSSNRTFAVLQIYKGLLHFYEKHASPMQLTLVKLLLMVKALLAFLVGVCTLNQYLVSTYRKALALL
jgi:GT2 family glycosyltransferase